MEDFLTGGGVVAMEIRDDISVEEYFEEVVPGIFSEQLGKLKLEGMDGTELTLQFDIRGESLKTYSVIVKDAKTLEVKKGPVRKPVVKIDLSENTWREAITGKIPGAVEMFADLGRLSTRSRYEQLKSTLGTLFVELSREGGENILLKIVFNEADSPSVKFITSLEDWKQISTGELSGVTAFMTNRLKIEGDMAFAMSLGSLVS